ncbi:MAG TPA: VanZ family protein [Thermoanaerobaculia bacterium]|jgi:glycopeptide antibiotics resistance protein
MGKREVRVVVVRKPVTIALLVIVSIAMLSLVYGLSGHAFVRAERSIIDIIALDAANTILFIPWGFLAFIALSPKRPRAMTYALTVVCGALFALVVAAWQSTLPAPVTAYPDTIWNVIGTFLGAIAAHLRKSVRIRFQI